MRALLRTGLLASTLLMACAAGPAAAAPAPAPAPPAGGARDAFVVSVRPGADARALARAAGVTPEVVLSEVMTGFVADLDEAQAAALRAHPDALFLEPDKPVRIAAMQPIVPGDGLHGLDRIDQRRLPLSGSYTTSADGTGVTVYVVDTGIATGHADFAGRAAVALDVLGGTGQDCNGHGTHVAGTIGGSTYGVAKRVSLRAVRALDCAGNGTTAGVLTALEWVRVHAVRPAVVNMSFTSAYSPALNDATAALSDAGIVTVAAAGNTGQAACSVSPASAPSAITVAAADESDNRASFSNHGDCVDVYAPGVGITSAAPDGSSMTMSGTSMAAPHAAGVAALHHSRSAQPDAAAVHDWVKKVAVRNVVRQNPRGTANLLLNTGGL